MPRVLELLISESRSRDEAEFALGDTLDVKASILLVVVIFLAGITGGLLASVGGEHGSMKWAQIVCAIFLFASGILIVYVIWPRAYLTEGENRASDLLKYFEENPMAEADPEIEITILKDDISETGKRIVHNREVNAKKSRALRWAFYTVIPALVLELLSAARVLLMHPS